MDLSQLTRGSLVMCRRSDGIFHEAKVFEITSASGQRIFKIHYIGWNKRYDENVLEADATRCFREHAKDNE